MENFYLGNIFSCQKIFAGFGSVAGRSGAALRLFCVVFNFGTICFAEEFEVTAFRGNIWE